MTCSAYDEQKSKMSDSVGESQGRENNRNNAD